MKMSTMLGDSRWAWRGVGVGGVKESGKMRQLLKAFRCTAC